MRVAEAGRPGTRPDPYRHDCRHGVQFAGVAGDCLRDCGDTHARGITDIATSAQAAEALRPIAGEFAFALFATGIIGTGLLAVPVLAGSAAYAVSEMFGWAGSLDARPNDARAFYATIAVATLLGAALSLVGLDPVRALYWAAVVNGVLAAPLMAVMMLIVRNPRVMGRLTLSRSMAIWGWAATAVMAAASLASFILP